MSLFGCPTCLAKLRRPSVKWHPQLVLRKQRDPAGVEEEAELMFIQSQGPGLFEFGMHVDENGDKRHWSDMPFQPI